MLDKVHNVTGRHDRTMPLEDMIGKQWSSLTQNLIADTISRHLSRFPYRGFNCVSTTFDVGLSTVDLEEA